ncbi:uncharacterized protein LOC129717471 [Wyeomyia smithii]|uniref:uncharacterized protein LOC129717471 n=1 Tax=Wyeomyia smithii TaxID=174621 RepID=UPI002467EE65|nr:uncharacterized protein LOC129717471 [Wyeomyia smithii]
MTTKNFVLCIRKLIYPSLVERKVKFPVIFFIDGHKSHTTFEAAEACLELGIVLVALHPNATRIIQPADVGNFGPLKKSWNRCVENVRQQGHEITLKKFGPVLEQAMSESLKQTTIISSFRRCGIFPFNANAVDYSKCLGKSVDRGNGSSLNSELGIFNDTLQNTSQPSTSNSLWPINESEETHQSVKERDLNFSRDFKEEAAYKLIQIEPQSIKQDLIADEISNSETIKNRRLSEFLLTPPTPTRKGKHINFKQKSYSILTAAERLTELRIEEEGKNAEMKKKPKRSRKEQH